MTHEIKTFISNTVTKSKSGAKIIREGERKDTLENLKKKFLKIYINLNFLMSSTWTFKLQGQNTQENSLHQGGAE